MIDVPMFPVINRLLRVFCTIYLDTVNGILDILMDKVDVNFDILQYLKNNAIGRHTD